MKVYGYIRVSTLTQAEKGLGLKTQEQEIIKYCKNNKLELIKIYKDEGISGTKADREGLSNLISLLNNSNKIIVLNTSRLWRSDIVKVLIHKELKKINADIISIEQPTYSIYNKDPNDFLINGMMELLDQYERMSISLKLSKGRKTKVRGGSKACGAAALGYRWNNKAEIITDEKTAPVIKLIFNKYLEIKSVQAVKNYLNENNYKTNSGKKFNNQSLINILKNDFYKGIITHGNLSEIGKHEILINPIIFGKVQKLLKAKSKKQIS